MVCLWKCTKEAVQHQAAKCLYWANNFTQENLDLAHQIIKWMGYESNNHCTIPGNKYRYDLKQSNIKIRHIFSINMIYQRILELNSKWDSDSSCQQHIKILLLFVWEFKSTNLQLQNIISKLQEQCDNHKYVQEVPNTFFFQNM